MRKILKNKNMKTSQFKPSKFIKLTFEDVEFICEIISKNSNDDFDDLFIDEENVENEVYDYFQDQIRYTDYEKVLKGYKENKLPKQIIKELYK